MAAHKFTEDDLGGFRMLRPLQRFLERLNAVATQRDRAHNRELFFDQYFLLLLLYFFNPCVDSLRGLQHATGFAKVQRRIGGRFSLGSLSEASRVFDAGVLQEVLRELALQAKPLSTGREAQALRQLTAVDGSLLPALPRMAWALWQDAEHRAAKMHVHWDVFACMPVDATLTAGSASEKTQLRRMLQPGRLYVADRGYAEYQLVQDIIDAQASCILRLQENAAYRVVEERTLTTEARAAGVIRDVVVDKLGSDHHRNVLKQPVRIVIVLTGKTNADGSPDLLVLCTDRLDLPADLVALGYKFRWTVELFFRWVKQVLDCRHLLSTAENGVAIQMYVALIASLLLALWSGKKPSKRLYETLCLYFLGAVTEDELQAVLEKNAS